MAKPGLNWRDRSPGESHKDLRVTYPRDNIPFFNWRHSSGFLFLACGPSSSICRDRSKSRGVQRIIRHGRTLLRTPRTHVSTAAQRSHSSHNGVSVYVRHSSIRRDILSDTKNLAGLVPRIGDEGFRKNDINIPSDVGRRKRGRKRRRTERERGVDEHADGVRQETGGY